MDANHPLRILMVEDVPSDAELAERELRNSGFQFTSVRVDTKEGFLKALEEFQPHLIISDYAMPEFDGMQALMLSLERDAKLPFIVLTGSMNEETAVDCMKAGATDYVIKDHLARLPFAVKEALDKNAAGKALAESENRYRLFVETAKEGVFSIDTEDRTTFANKAMGDMLGYEPAEMMGRRVDTFMFPEDLKDRSDKMEDRKHGRDSVYERRLRCKNGETRWAIVSACPLHDEQGKVTGSFAMITDVTERKQAEEALKNQYELMATLLDTIPSPIYYKDTAGVFLGCNHAWSELTGISKENAIGMTVYDMGPAEIVERYEAADRNLFDHPGVQTYDWKVKAADGSVKDVIFNKATFQDSGGHVAGLVGVIIDITERKQAERRLADLHSQHQLVLEAAAEGILGLDSNGIHTFVNPAAATMLGYKVEELLGRPSHSLWHHTRADGSAYPEEQCEIHACLRQGLALRAHIDLFWRKDGTSFPVEFACSPIVQDGVPVAVVVTFSDVTERKQAEKQLHDTLESLRRAVNTTIQVMVSAVETRDPYTAGHQIRSADLARAIAAEMGLSQDRIEGIHMAASIHDIGKLSIPAEILAKPTKLSEIEFSLIKEHAWKGYEILRNVESPWPLAQIVYEHHERMDGSGYPRNLKGDEIIMEARIMAVADVVESMASHRPYRAALGIDAALEEIEKNKGTHYDEAVADACLRLFREKEHRLVEA